MAKRRNIILTEAQLNQILGLSNIELLTEDQASKSISDARNLLMQKLGWSKEEADQFIRINLRGDITALRTKQGGKFILGCTRMFIDGQLNNAATINRLNSTLKYVMSDAHINEYDRNLNGLSANELINRFSSAMNADTEKERNEVNQMRFNEGSDYEIVRIDDFDEACEYNRYMYKGSPWCITYSQENYNNYTRRGTNQIYFCLKDGFENMRPVQGEDCPLDEYGLSMISVIVDDQGNLAYSTCRWNHDNGGSDNVLNVKEISQLVGRNFYDTFKPNTRFKDMLDKVKRLLSTGGYSIDYVFDRYQRYKDKWIVVLNERYNIYDPKTNDFMLDQWYDTIIANGDSNVMIVLLNNMYNVMDLNGRVLLDKWYDYIADFSEGFAVVMKNQENGGDVYNYVSENGTFLSEEWFLYAKDFSNDRGIVTMVNKKMNFIDRDGDFVFENGVDGLTDINNGYSIITHNGKRNLVDTNGQVLSKKWFSIVLPMHVCGYARIGMRVGEHKFKYNLLSKDGEVALHEYVDEIASPTMTNPNLFTVKSDLFTGEKYNLFNAAEGRLTLDPWLDAIGYGSYNGDIIVGRDGLLNFVNREGHLVMDKWYQDVTIKRSKKFVKVEGEWMEVDDNGKIIGME